MIPADAAQLMVLHQRCIRLEHGTELWGSLTSKKSVLLFKYSGILWLLLRCCIFFLLSPQPCFILYLQVTLNLKICSSCCWLHVWLIYDSDKCKVWLQLKPHVSLLIVYELTSSFSQSQINWTEPGVPQMTLEWDKPELNTVVGVSLI